MIFCRYIFRQFFFNQKRVNNISNKTKQFINQLSFNILVFNQIINIINIGPLLPQESVNRY